MTFMKTVDDGIITFTFDNNGYNSINTEVLHGLHDAVRQANSDDSVKGIIITGQGRIFSSGYELGTFISFKDDADCLEWGGMRESVIYDLFTCKKPVVAAINGHAMAAGLIVAMAADYRIVVNNPKVKMGMPEINIGIPLSNSEAEVIKFGFGSDKNYRDMMFTGAQINPETALQKGLVDELAADRAELIEKAQAKIIAMMDAPGRAFVMLKQVEKRHVADYIQANSSKFDWQGYAACFFKESVMAAIKKVKASMG